MSLGSNNSDGSQLPLRWVVIFTCAVMTAVFAGLATGLAVGIPAGLLVGSAAGMAAAIGTFLTAVGLFHQILPTDGP